jgi:hypothetical protein
LSFPDSNRYYQGFEYMFIFSKGAPKTFNALNDRKNVSAGADVHGKDRNPDGSLKERTGKGKVTTYLTQNGSKHSPTRRTFYTKLTCKQRQENRDLCMSGKFQKPPSFLAFLLASFCACASSLLECLRWF